MMLPDVNMYGCRVSSVCLLCVQDVPSHLPGAELSSLGGNFSLLQVPLAPPAGLQGRFPSEEDR